ncbi:YmfQ family protein [Acinetobacter guillouiae]|uniref:YmfQ family protein n=1 Tax=Acinetobacter guillouiae TaxID=106649 RepID=UPI0032B38F3E
MAQSRFSLEQYTGAVKTLLPRGRVWSRAMTGTQHELIEGIAKSFQDVDADAMQLLIEAFPATTTQLLDEWNLTVGIPDFCFGAPDSIEQNRQYIVAKLIADGGQSNDYYIAIAKSLGINIVIREFSPSHFDADAPDGLIIKPGDWWHTWKVVIDVNSPSLIEFAGDETAIKDSNSYKALMCLLNRYKPAHTQFYSTLIDFVEIEGDPIFGFMEAEEDAEPFGQGRFYK